MGKLLLSIVILLIVVTVGVNLFGSALFAKVVGDAVGAPVKVGDVRLDILKSRIGIHDLKVGNPEGFDKNDLASIPEISVAYDLPAFFKGTAHIKEIVLNIQEVVVEKNEQNQINLMQLAPVRNMNAGKAEENKPAETEKEEQKKSGKAMTVQIDRVDLTIGGARYIETGNGKQNERSFPVDVNHQILTDVTNPRQITQQIVSIILKKVGMAELTSQLGVFTKGLETQVKADMVKASAGNFANKLKANLT